MILLDAKDVAFAYGHRRVLSGVTLQLLAGEVVALLGPNGAGKSTLIRSLLGQLHSSGEVVWDGRPLRAWGRKELAKKIAYLPQSPLVDPGQRVAEVLRTGRAPFWGAFGIESREDARIVQEVAGTTGITELLPRLMGELSGGQRQLVFVARCLVQQPVAVMLDEPDTFLDLKNGMALTGLLRRLTRETNLAVMIASHDLNLAGEFADRLILLNEGAVAAQGTPARVLDPELVGKVYGIRMRRIDVPDRAAPCIFPEPAPP